MIKTKDRYRVVAGDTLEGTEMPEKLLREICEHVHEHPAKKVRFLYLRFLAPLFSGLFMALCPPLGIASVGWELPGN